MAEPTEAEVIRGGIVSWLTDVHTSLPGKVISYDAATQSAAIQPAVQRAIPSDDGWTHVDYPVIPAAKVVWLAGGGSSLQLPLTAGDSVWLLFSEACWAQYRRTGQIAPPGDQRRFDLSYPIALPVQLVTALRNVTGPHFEIPDGQALTVGGDPSEMNFVALANLIADRFTEINADITTLKTATATGLGTIPVVGSSTASTFTSSTSAVPANRASVAATKLKTQ